MTAAEATTIRTAALAALTGADLGTARLGIHGRFLENRTPKELMELIAVCDSVIAQESRGAFIAVQFRPPE